MPADGPSNRCRSRSWCSVRRAQANEFKPVHENEGPGFATIPQEGVHPANPVGFVGATGKAKEIIDEIPPVLEDPRDLEDLGRHRFEARVRLHS